MADETTYYEDGEVRVTNARAILRGKTYALANVTSVSLFKKNPNRTLPVISIILGILSFGTASVANNTSTACISIGVLLILVGIVILYVSKPQYMVRIGSASGEADALVSNDRETIHTIVAAMNKAIADRG